MDVLHKHIKGMFHQYSWTSEGLRRDGGTWSVDQWDNAQKCWAETHERGDWTKEGWQKCRWRKKWAERKESWKSNTQNIQPRITTGQIERWCLMLWCSTIHTLHTLIPERPGRNSFSSGKSNVLIILSKYMPLNCVAMQLKRYITKIYLTGSKSPGLLSWG